MKKLLTLTLTAIMALTVLTGCGSDPLEDDFVKFFNTDMVPISEKAGEIQTATEEWSALGDENAMIEYANNTLIPLVDEALDLMEDINPETDEVKSLKNTFQTGLSAYKEAFEMAVSDLQTGGTMEEPMAKMEEATAQFNEFDVESDALADELGLELE